MKRLRLLKRLPHKYLLLTGLILYGAGLAIITVQMYLYRTSPRIIYLAKNDNDALNFWMINLANPNELHQITAYKEPGTRINSYQLTQNGRYILYSLNNIRVNEPVEVHLLDLWTRSMSRVGDCLDNDWYCLQFSISPDGQYVAYHRFSMQASELRLINLTSEPLNDMLIHEFSRIQDPSANLTPAWIGNSGLLAFNILTDAFEVQVYDPKQNRFHEVLPLGTPNRMAIFSADGSRYVYYSSQVHMDPRIIEVRETANPTEPIASYVAEWESDDYELMRSGWIGASFYDWHPDNERLVIGVHNIRLDSENPFYQTNLAIFNTTTDELLFLPPPSDVYSDTYGRWNSDGTRIVFQRYDYQLSGDCYCDQLVIYDTLSGQTQVLPISGAQPEWVNADD